MLSRRKPRIKHINISRFYRISSIADFFCLFFPFFCRKRASRLFVCLFSGMRLAYDPGVWRPLFTIRISPAALVLPGGTWKRTPPSMIRSMPYGSADADRTATLFSVFLGMAVFFNLPLTFRAADFFTIQRIISDIRLIFPVENDTLWRKSIRKT